MISSQIKNIKILLSLIAFTAFAIAAVAADMVPASPFNAEVHVEIGIDSLERSYYKPWFRFEFPLAIGTVFSEISYYQVTGGKLQGRIDYWANIGLEKKLNGNLALEIRLNHMCRHLPSTKNPVVFDLNEVTAKLWFLSDHFKIAPGFGTYTGGFADYRNLLQLDGEFPHIFGSEVSFRYQFKWVDFKVLLHEAELFFSLSKSTDLFLRNSRHYELKNRSYFGVRMKSTGEVEKYIDSLRMSADIYPSYKPHKLTVDGEFRLAFFRKPRRRVLVSVRFIAPILRGDAFFTTFFPEEMIYPLSLLYQRKIKESLFIGWYSNYHLSMPLDTDREFSSSWSTGVDLRNQWDFERMEKRVRFDLFAGYNFKYTVEAGAKLGVSFLKVDGLNVGANLGIEYSREQLSADFKLFLDYGRDVTFRPFVGLERHEYLNSPQRPTNRFTFGFRFFRWFN